MMFSLVNCATCATQFQVQLDTIRRRREDGIAFYCPSGHANVYRPSENERLKKRVEELEAALQRMKNDRDYYEQRTREEVAAGARLARSNRGLRAYLAGLKKKRAKAAAAEVHAGNLAVLQGGRR